MVLEALARAGELTQRMFKGILAEAACKVEVIDKLTGWDDVTPPGMHAFDFVVRRGADRVTIQTKLQRKQGGKPFMYRVPGQGRKATQLYVVETQKSRRGSHRSSGANTRPYRFSEFDILAVCMEPVTGDWSQFRFTLSRWLHPRLGSQELIAVYQPVSLQANSDWTDSLAIAIDWWRSGQTKTISAEHHAESGGRADSL